jgi:hypothetical protein
MRSREQYQKMILSQMTTFPRFSVELSCAVRSA